MYTCPECSADCEFLPMDEAPVIELDGRSVTPLLFQCIECKKTWFYSDTMEEDSNTKYGYITYQWDGENVTIVEERVPGGQPWEPRGISGVIGVLFTIGAILVAVFFAGSCVVCTFTECDDGTERRDGDPRFPVH